MDSDYDDASDMNFSRDEQPVVKKPSKLKGYADQEAGKSRSSGGRSQDAGGKDSRYNGEDDSYTHGNHTSAPEN